MTADTIAADARQPKVLYQFFMTELWERFRYYSMVSIFTLCLVNELKMADAQAFLILGANTSFACLTTVAGGIAADRLPGFGRTIVLGALVVGCGYMVPGLAGRS